MIARPFALMLLAAAPVPMLTGCDKPANEKAAASGEILPGSASDAMIPEDRLTSQPPLDPGAVRNAEKDADEASGTEPAKEEATAAPAPAETKAAERAGAQ